MARDRSLRQRKQAEGGATVVEFAVVVPLLLTVLFAILEFGFIFMQEHFVANAAREGLRVGIRANNYSCFNGVPAGCPAGADRAVAVETAVLDYLAPLYAAPAITVTQAPSPGIDGGKRLRVTVAVDNFFPALVSALVPDFVAPATISFVAAGEFEDPDEP